MSAPHGYKLAALFLAGWSASDRRWALSQLPIEQRESLSALLAEIVDRSLPVLSADILRSVAPTESVDQRSQVAEELLPLRPLLAGLSTRWATRLLGAWKISPTAARSLIDDPVKADAVGRDLHARGGRPQPPRLSACLRELSARHANVLSANDACHG